MSSGQTRYSKRLRKEIIDEEYARWVFRLGEYYEGQSE
jgi:hypothetical protein